ncbi:Hypothetical predicted protein [Mytilus galloprovincialis]|uniref:B box-type domain-containing protein n=1 Tax=Mytilus galloprovincialis TaxID=29158 RepID=A0A8B6H120_MYTGA|nr:Hypothetical predicted protein [Mytilus galloprovincialis]
MAFSQPTDEAQTPAFCQFCEESSDIKWKCINCDVFMCQLCTTKIHTKLKSTDHHGLINLKDYGREDVAKTIRKERLEKLLLDGDENYQVIKDEILLTKKEMTETISNYAKQLLDDLDSIWKPTENMIKLELSDIQKNNEDLLQREDSLKKVLQSHKASEIFSSRTMLNKNLPTKSVETINCNILKTKFVSGKIFKKQNIGKTLFGNLYEVPDLELVREYHSEIINIWNILNCDSNKALIASYTGGKLQKVLFDGNKIKVEEDFSISVLNMAKLGNDEILLSTGESDLQVYSIDRQFKPFKSFSPLKSISVHVSQTNRIFVGLVECFPITFPAKKDSVRRVVVLNLNGDLQHIYEYDKDNQRLFTSPWKIITLKDTMIIIDRVNKNFEGRVIGLDYGGKLLWTYNGCDTKLDSGKFYPIDISTNSSGTIFVADKDNHAVHVLNSTGEFIVCKVVKSIGIELPVSLDIDKNGILWIGCNTWKANKDSKAKIFSVKLV